MNNQDLGYEGFYVYDGTTCAHIYHKWVEWNKRTPRAEYKTIKREKALQYILDRELFKKDQN
jgi:hypothetical protein